MEWKEILQRDAHVHIGTQIARPYFKETRSSKNITQHTFTDAILRAYVVCGNHSMLIISRNRVTITKKRDNSETLAHGGSDRKEIIETF